MVAQVIKLPSAATNNIQSKSIGVSATNTTSAQDVRVDTEKAREVAEKGFSKY